MITKPTTSDNPTAETDTYEQTKADFVTSVVSAFGKLQSEISERNGKIQERDNFIYGDSLNSSLQIPIGHDFTGVNWLRRTVEIHKNMFMSRGFQVISTYDSKDPNTAASQEDRGRIGIENDKQKEYAESRVNLIKSIMRDNGGDAFWASLAENASAVGDSAVKAYWNEDEQKYELNQIESVENLYALWGRDDFRVIDAYAYVYQVSKQLAIESYGASKDCITSPMGNPMQFDNFTQTNVGSLSSQPMVSIIEITGKIEGWGAENGKVKNVEIGKETEINCLIIGQELKKLITEPKKMPKYYILPNKRQRRRAWGTSDVSEAAININLTYIETLSDWRTVSSKVNFPKFKAFGFPPTVEIPKPESRKIQYLPLTEGQDIVELQGSNSDGIDWQRQLDELKEQYVRETGISRVLFDDPSVTFNSNQALLTSMKPTSDIAEAKKQLWEPVITQIFQDALETIALNKPDLAEVVSSDDNWTLKIMWPSVMQKEDPVYQSMLLNRFNAGLMSSQSYMEAQGDSKEELDRIRDEMTDPITAAILGKQMPLIAQTIVNAATAEIQQWFMAMTTPPDPKAQGSGNTSANTPGINSNGGGSTPLIPGDSVSGGAGLAPVSQPGSGATSTSPAGAVAQSNQAAGG